MSTCNDHVSIFGAKCDSNGLECCSVCYKEDVGNVVNIWLKKILKNGVVLCVRLLYAVGVIQIEEDCSSINDSHMLEEHWSLQTSVNSLSDQHKCTSTQYKPCWEYVEWDENHAGNMVHLSSKRQWCSLDHLGMKFRCLSIMFDSWLCSYQDKCSA